MVRAALAAAQASKVMEVNLNKVETAHRESAPVRAWLMGLAGWLVPGLGHLLQGKWVRALLLGGAVWICFIPPMIGDLGSGLLYIFCWVKDVGFSHGPQPSALPTFEYGWTFLLVAGLLNYLAMLDAFDIAAGRKS